MTRWLVAAALSMAIPAMAQVNAQFAAGETLDYDLTWLAISGGKLRLTIGLVPNDATHLRMTSVAKSNPSFSFIYKVRDEIVSIVNRDDFSTLRYDKHLNERGRIKDDSTFVDEQSGIATRQRPKHTPQHVPVPKPVFDPLSLVYHLRTLELQPGHTQTFTVVADGKVYRLDAKVTGRETLRTPAGTFRTVVVEPKMLSGGLFRGEGALTIWYSDDVRHIPVRIRSDVKIGSIAATLRGISESAGDPEPPSR